jgi:hypothetical protein
MTQEDPSFKMWFLRHFKKSLKRQRVKAKINKLGKIPLPKTFGEVWYKLTDISEELTATIVTVMETVSASETLVNISDYIVIHPRQQPSSHPLPWEPQITRLLSQPWFILCNSIKFSFFWLLSKAISNKTKCQWIIQHIANNDENNFFSCSIVWNPYIW